MAACVLTYMHGKGGMQSPGKEGQAALTFGSFRQLEVWQGASRMERIGMMLHRLIHKLSDP